MEDIYLIIYGLKTCSDNDHIIGYAKSERKAKEYVDEMNSTLDDDSSYHYLYEKVSPI